jgi:hypothetical protein
MQKRYIQEVNDKGLYIQNILAGPLVICDPPSIKDGIHLDPLQPGQVEDLSYYSQETLGRSIALNTAVKRGYVMILSEDEYYEQIELENRRIEAESLEIERQMGEAHAAGNVFEAEKINVTAGGNPHGDYSAEALLAQKNTISNSDIWAAEYRSAKEKGLVRTPIEFRELVDSGKISLASSGVKRGRRVSLDEIPQDQVSMTATKATVGMPGVYSHKNNDGFVSERGEVYAAKRSLGNFNATGNLPGATNIGVQDTPTPTYAAHPQNVRQAQEDDFVDEIDLDQDDSSYEASKMNYNNQFANTISRQSPYIGRR